MISLLLLPASLPSPIPGGIDLDAFANGLVALLPSAAKLPAMAAAVVGAIIGLAVCAVLITKYYVNENARRDEAYRESKRLELEHNQNLQRIATDYAKAAGDLLGDAYKQDYARYCALITSKDYPNVLIKIARQYDAAVSEFLYDETKSPQDRAALVIHLVSGNQT